LRAIPPFFLFVGLLWIVGWLLLSACAQQSNQAQAAFGNAQKAYQRFLEDNPPKERTRAYLNEIYLADTALREKHYQQAEEHARAAEQLASKGWMAWSEVIDETKTNLGKILEYLESRVSPRSEVEMLYDDAKAAFDRKDYVQATAKVKEAQELMHRSVKVAMADDLLRIDETLSLREEGIKSVKIYKDMNPNTNQPDNPIGTVPVGEEVSFIKAKRISISNKYFLIRTINGIEGWVDQRYIRKVTSSDY
jgi:tetratricopeptide (TPR) repeat protein